MDKNKDLEKQQKQQQQEYKQSVVDNYIQSAKMAESGGNPNAQSTSSSARGLFQFTKPTWGNIEKQLGRKLDIDNPTHQEIAMRALTANNVKTLESNGFEVNNNTLYALHHFGEKGGIKMLVAAKTNPNASASSILGAQAAKANKSLFFDSKGNPVSISNLFNKTSEHISKQKQKAEPGADLQQQIDQQAEMYQQNTPERRQLNQEAMGQQVEQPVVQNNSQNEFNRIKSIGEFLTPTKIENLPVPQQTQPTNKVEQNREALGLSGGNLDFLSKDLYTKSTDPNKLDLSNFRDGGELNYYPDGGKLKQKQQPPTDKGYFRFDQPNYNNKRNYNVPDPPKPKPAPPKPKEYEDFSKEYEAINKAKRDTLNKANTNTYFQDLTPGIKLQQDRYRGVNLDRKMVDELVSAAKNAKVNPMDMLGLAARESTFGQGYSKIVGKLQGNTGKERVVSGWDVAEKYLPYNIDRFLADNKVPGIERDLNEGKYDYYVGDDLKVNEHLKKHPELYAQYMNKLKQTKTIGNKNAYDMAAEFIKEKGIARYNPGDKDYTNKVNKDKQAISKEKELMEYLKKKHNVTYEYGGFLRELKYGGSLKKKYKY